MKWKKVEDGLPPIGTAAIVANWNWATRPYSYQRTGPEYTVRGAVLREVSKEGHGIWEMAQLSSGHPICPMHEVTHWMPLPEAPHVKRSQHWECNECGGSDWTDAISEYEIENELVSCSMCGGTEFHLVDDQP